MVVKERLSYLKPCIKNIKIMDSRVDFCCLKDLCSLQRFLRVGFAILFIKDIFVRIIVIQCDVLKNQSYLPQTEESKFIHKYSKLKPSIRQNNMMYFNLSHTY